MLPERVMLRSGGMVEVSDWPDGVLLVVQSEDGSRAGTVIEDLDELDRVVALVANLEGDDEEDEDE